MSGLDRLDVMGTVWVPGRPERTRIGRLIEAAKDRADDSAAALLAADVGEWAQSLERAAGVVVVPVPPSPDRPNRLVPAVATALADAWAASVVDAVSRHAVTPPLRTLEPDDRPEAARDADYRVGSGVDGMRVVLVDDVVLTGTTLDHLAGLLRRAGAIHVGAVVLARSRRG